MMRGRLYIDGVDAYLAFGAYVIEGGYNDLVKLPPLKTPQMNEWQEEDGVDVDLSMPVLDTKEVQVKFALSDVYNSYFALTECLGDTAYHTFDCREIGRIFKLRLTQCPSLDSVKMLGFAIFKFADDFPTELDENVTYVPTPVGTQTDAYMLDNCKFTEYGVRVLEGSLNDIVKIPQVKPNLLRNISTVQGAIYDNETVTYKSKDVQIYCLARAASLEQLWHNLDCLLYSMTRPGEHLLAVRELEESYPCYYKECNVSEFYADQIPWLKFTLTFVFTHPNIV